MICSFIFYGIIYNKINKMIWDTEGITWKDYISKKLHIVQPIKNSAVEETKKYWNDRHKILQEIGVVPELYGTPKAYNYAFCILDSLLINTDQYPEIINPKEIEIDKTWDNKLKQFCELSNTEFLKPNWYLTYYAD